MLVFARLHLLAPAKVLIRIFLQRQQPFSVNNAHATMLKGETKKLEFSSSLQILSSILALKLVGCERFIFV